MDTPPALHESPLVGQIMDGKWRVLHLLGRGGMGVVYAGQNVGIGKRVALKFLDDDAALEPRTAERFRREAEAASLVESAHIVHVFDSGTAPNGLPYIVMELLLGEDLRSRLERAKTLTVREALHIVSQSLRGLHRAHEAGIVHRDLKPDNIFLVNRDDDSSFVKLLDFGISKIARRDEIYRSTLTQKGTVMGTPAYMSPEQAQGLPEVDHRTDLWAIGAILYECLSGEPPHRGDSYEQVIVSICTRETPDIRTRAPGVSGDWAAFLAKALEKEPSRRFQSAEEMLVRLQSLSLDQGSSPASEPPARRSIPRWAVGLLVTVLGFAATLLALSLLPNRSLGRRQAQEDTRGSNDHPTASGGLLPNAAPEPAVPSAQRGNTLVAPPPALAGSSGSATADVARDPSMSGRSVPIPRSNRDAKAAREVSARATGGASSASQPPAPRRSETGVAGELQIKTSYP